MDRLLFIKYQREKAQREAETDEDEPLMLKYLRET
jgi:hypothetical protein